MSIPAASLVAEVRVTGDSEAKNKLSEVGGTVEKTSGMLGGLKHALSGAFSFIAQGGVGNVSSAFGALKSGLSSILQESFDAQAGMALTNAVLKSTHDASGMTADAIANLAGDLSHLTKFSDDTVQSGENMLLTFTNIGKNVFPQATKTVLDMSQALGQDTKNSAIQLGKALNDPLTGITALSRVGVTFDDQQKKLIKTYMAHNDIASAQGIILKELQREFGGAAEAAGKTFGGQLAILHQRIADIKQNIGDALLPILTKFVGLITDTILPGLEQFGQNAWAMAERFGGAIAHFLAPFVYFFQYVGYIAKSAFQDVADTLTQVGQIVRSVFRGFGGSDGGDNPIVMFFSNIITKAYPLVQSIGQAFHGFMITIQKDLSVINPQIIIGALHSIADFISGQIGEKLKFFGSLIQQIGDWFQSSLIPAFKGALPGFESLASAIIGTVIPALIKIWGIMENAEQAIIPVFVKAFETIVPIVIRVAGIISTILGAAIRFLVPYIVQAAQAIGGFVSQIASQAMPIIQQLGALINTVIDVIVQVWNAVWPNLVGPLTTAWNLFVDIIKAAWTTITGLFKAAMTVIGGLIEFLSGLFKTIGGVIGFFVDLFTGKFNKLGGDLGKIFGGIGDMFKGIVQTIQGVFSGIGSFFQGVWNGVVGIFKAAINFIIDGIDGAIRWLNSLHVDLGPIHISLPHISEIPKLASGIDDFAGGLAYVHKNELLVNMPRGTSVIPANQVGSWGMAQGGASAAASAQPIILQVDGRTFARLMMPHLTSSLRHDVGVAGL